MEKQFINYGIDNSSTQYNVVSIEYRRLSAGNGRQRFVQADMQTVVGGKCNPTTVGLFAVAYFNDNFIIASDDFIGACQVPV